MTWKDNELTKAVILSSSGGNCRIRTNIPVKVENTEVVDASGENPNPFFHFIEPGSPGITDSSQLPDVQIKKSYTVDFNTQKGKIYTLIPKE